MRFVDRSDAGKKLGQLLATKYRGRQGVVYALPRGGIVLGDEVATALNMPLDLVITRKIGHPDNPEFAIAAITENGSIVADREQISQVDDEWFRRHAEVEQREARRRRQAYLGGQPHRSAHGITAIVVDDGIATGLTMEAAVSELRRDRPARLVVAVPVAPTDTVARFASAVDEFVALDIPDYYLGAVGAYYESFPQVSDDEVVAILKKRQPSTVLH